MTEGMEELLSWINRNMSKWTCENYSVQDVANLAIACGFKRAAVSEWQMANVKGWLE
jgi:hypothetical protein